ncbi:MAG: DAK2 domain-containing protein [Acidimicrobiia bacterium]
MRGPRPLEWEALREVITRYHRLLVSHRAHLNELNVFPVADSDTGTNLALTLQIVVDSLDEASGMASVCEGIVQGSLRGARGSSGVIMAQFLGAFAQTMARASTVDSKLLAAALQAGSDAAYSAVVEPVEGTILTVAREASQAAVATADLGMEPTLTSAVEASAAALERTREMLPQLRDAGVVDAGGKGMQLFLETLTAVILDEAIAPSLGSGAGPTVTRTEEIPRYEVVIRLIPGETSLESFKQQWAELGDASTVVVASDGLWVGHIHTNSADAAIAAAKSAGSIVDLQVTDLQAGDHEGGE